MSAIAMLGFLPALRSFLGSPHPVLIEENVEIKSNELLFQLNAEAGDLLYLTVAGDPSANADIVLLNSLGEPVPSLEDPTRNGNPQRFFTTAEQLGHYLIQIKPASPSPKQVFEIRFRTLTDPRELQEARNRISIATIIFQESGPPESQALAYRLLGEISGRLFDWQKAISYFKEARTLSRDHNDRRAEAAATQHLGNVYSLLGNTDSALSALSHSIHTSKLLSDDHREMLSLLDRAWIYREIGEVDRSNRDLGRSLELSRRLAPESIEFARGLALLSKIQADSDSEVAEKNLELALSLVQALDKKSRKPQTMLALGRALRSFQRDMEAENIYRIGAAQANACGNKATETAFLLALAELELDTGKLSEALVRSKRAEMLATSLNHTSMRWRAQHLTGRIHTASGHSAQAEKALRQAAHLVETIKPISASSPSFGAWLTARRRVYSDLVTLLMEQHRINPTGGFSEKAYNASERLHFLDKFEWEIPKKTDHTFRALGLFKNAAQMIEQERSLLTLEETQLVLLDEGVLLLHYFLGDKSSYLWAISSDRFESHELPPRAEIETCALQIHREIQRSRNRRIEPWVDCLRSMLLEPIASPLTVAETIAFVPDGVLHYAPFELLLGTQGQQPLRVRSVRFPSASLLALIRSRRAVRDEETLSLAIVADPVFSLQDPRLKGLTTDFGLQPSQMRLVRPVQETTGLQRLPFSRTEGESIASHSRSLQTLEAYGFAANRKTVLDGSLDSYQILHFATHGIADQNHPGLSRLVLSLFDDRGRPQAGTVAAYEIAALELSAELVVLSACSTGIGLDLETAGVNGLAPAFLKAGSSSVVSSLWPVDDRTTAIFMERFYRGLLGNRVPAAEALRQAQLWMQEQPQSSQPFFWAGFALHGDWR